MGHITVVNNISLDGVMQAPGRPEEDTRGGFEHGGWAGPYNDEEKAKAMGGMMARGAQASRSGLLLGRRTYEDFFQVWPGRTDNPFTEVLDNSQKYVASTTLQEPLPWVNSTLLSGDAADAVSELKDESDIELTILGSGVVIQSLAKRGLIDTYVLLIHPLILGRGRRLFADDGDFAKLEMTESITTTTGVVIATYRS
ncbi:MAG: hypothetical protein QOG62_152 [Thermoleophilaceae bacterium]|jgi:dihydrofolate reductase|nr:hypothetical protein [Thermoleophilaceae bacterium]